MKFSESLACRMKERCETKYALAKSLNVEQATVARWLNGVTKPRLAHIGRLADHYGVSVEELQAEIENGG